MMIVFDPVGTPWYSVLLLLTIANKRWVLATRFHPDTGPEYLLKFKIQKYFISNCFYFIQNFIIDEGEI